MAEYFHFHFICALWQGAGFEIWPVQSVSAKKNISEKEDDLSLSRRSTFSQVVSCTRKKKRHTIKRSQRLISHLRILHASKRLNLRCFERITPEAAFDYVTKYFKNYLNI